MPRNTPRNLPLKRPALVLTALALVFAAGCASAPKEEPAPAAAVFYPPAPDAPRLQFLTSFSDATHLVTTKSSFAEFVVGTEQQEEAPGTLHAPYGIATYNGKLYICDIPLRCVHVYDLVNKGYTRLGRPDTFFGPVNINIDADGTNLTYLTPDGENNGSARWLSNSRIVFASVRDGNFEIYVMDNDGSNQQRLTNNPSTDSSPCATPSDDKILFVSSRTGTPQIFLMNLDGSNPVNLSNNAFGDGTPRTAGR